MQISEDDLSWLQEKGALFSAKRCGNPFSSKCVGCVNGLIIKIQCPPLEDGQIEFSNQKGFYAVVCQGLCDANYHFLFFSSNATGLIYVKWWGLVKEDC